MCYQPLESFHAYLLAPTGVGTELSNSKIKYTYITTYIYTRRRGGQLSCKKYGTLQNS